MVLLRNWVSIPWATHHLRRHLSRSTCKLASDAATTDDTITLYGKTYKRDGMSNVTPSIISKLDRNLHHKRHHPLQIIKSKIRDHFYANYRSRSGGCIFAMIDNLNPVVTVEQNFDSLLVPQDHVSRSKNDNYYINSEYVLRAHTTAHEVDLLMSGWNAFLNCGDVYRRDEIDRSHYPVFHQLEGVRVFDDHELFGEFREPSLRIMENQTLERSLDKQECYTLDATRIVEYQLKYCLEQLVQYLFGDDVETRWVDAYFPFTHPSWELEVKFNDQWMEMLGCGILEQKILQKAGCHDKIGWAFGLGLERFAMKLFSIPDIRLFWSEDQRFLSQFEADENATFKPFSKYPSTYKDISFWIGEGEEFSSNDLFEIVRSVADNMVEEMNLIDEFKHPKTNRISVCYRVTFRAMDRTLTDKEINEVENVIREKVRTQLNVELR